MARDVITPQQLTQAGLTPAAGVVGVAANDLSFVATRTTFIEVVNSNAAARTVSVVTSLAPGGLALADIDVVVPATGRKIIWPFQTLPLDYFDQGSSDVYVDITNDTDLTFYCFKL